VQINVSQQLKEPIGSARTYDIDEVVEVLGEGVDVQGKVNLVRTDRGILARGTIYTSVRVTCSRCLITCPCGLTLDIVEEYYPITDVLTGAPLPLPGEPGAFTIDEHHILDLTEAMRQYAVMAIPMKPLCRVSCAGLCPTCGHNLNDGPCGCPPQDTDPRWAVLRGLARPDDSP